MKIYIFEIEADFKIISEYGNYLTDTNRTFRYGGHTLDHNDYTQIDLNIKMPIGQTVISYNNYTFIFDFIRDSTIVGLSNATSKHMELYLTIECESKDIAHQLLKKFVFDAIEHAKIKSKNKIMRMIYKASSGWIALGDICKRDIDTVYMDEKVKKEIVDDLNLFLNSKNKYLEYGVPYSKTYLFEGPPSSGKTSLIWALASILNKNIAMINFNQQLDDALLMKALSLCDSSNIIVLENIDAFLDDKIVTVNGLLNVIDGFGKREGMIIFITTNNFNKMENIFTKLPGRLDSIVHFTHPTKSQIESMFEKFLPNQKEHFEKFYGYSSKKNIPLNVLQKFLFNNMDCENILTKQTELMNMMSCSKQSSDNMYS
jgi:SpoVK/Ycf46/Vps4 family AAA+-type ATPase